MDHDLGHDEQGQGQEEARLRFEVLQEREPDPRQRLPLQDRQDEERHPGQQGDGHDPPPQEIEGRLHQPAAQEELVERPAQHEREVVRRVGRQTSGASRCSVRCWSSRVHGGGPQPPSAMARAESRAPSRTMEIPSIHA